MSLLSEEQIRAELRALPGWELRGGALEKTFDCRHFDGSMAFVNALAAVANELDHHPDLTISWNAVTCSLSSHDAGGITERDLRLARAIEQIGGRKE